MRVGVLCSVNTFLLIYLSFVTEILLNINLINKKKRSVILLPSVFRWQILPKKYNYKIQNKEIISVVFIKIIFGTLRKNILKNRSHITGNERAFFNSTAYI